MKIIRFIVKIYRIITKIGRYIDFKKIANDFKGSKVEDNKHSRRYRNRGSNKSKPLKKRDLSSNKNN